MNRTDRLRRVVILSGHCLRNMAFAKAGGGGRVVKGDPEFWITVYGNFLDIALLEWSKLFADPRGKHCWCSVVPAPERPEFEHLLLERLKITAKALAAYIDEVRTYRDKFIAHLDDHNWMHIPNLDIAYESTMFYAEYALRQDPSNPDPARVQAEMRAQYLDWLRDGQVTFKTALKR